MGALIKYDPHDFRCGVFWMNDQELLLDTDADLDRKAAAFRANGCNWVLTFSCTHFRWSFFHYWDQINAALRRVVAACHDHGIRVIEHHSAVLTHAPRDEQGRDWLERCLKTRKSSMRTWPRMIGGEAHNPVILDGRRLTDFYSIHGRSGEPLYARHGHVICPNNPFYLRAYLKYLETVYAAGVDGIMTDDVIYGYCACVCEFCRRDFTEQTGLQLPASGAEFDRWHGNWDDPLFRAFVDFRRHMVERFHFAVKQHYEAMGLDLFRPNYERLGLYQHRDAYCLQTLPALDLIWQEAGGAHILDYSWPSWAVEAAQRFAVGRYRGIPSALFAYPTSVNQWKLTWGLAMSWGQRFTGTGEGYVNEDGERVLRDFEVRHARYLRQPRKISTLAFYDSRVNRNNVFKYEKEPRDRLVGWALGCAMASVPFDIVETEELRERIGFYRLVVLREIRFMADWELAVFRTFMENGGVVLWAGDTARCRPDWSERAAADIAGALRLPDFIFPSADAAPAVHPIGTGKLVACGGLFLQVGYEREHMLDWWNNDLQTKPTVPFQRLPERDRSVRQSLVEFLKGLLPGGSVLRVDNLPADVIATVFLTDAADAAVIHLVNAAGILDKPDGQLVGHGDPGAIPFPSHAGRPPLVFTLRLPDSARLPESPQARYFDPDRPVDEGVPLEFEWLLPGTLRVAVPSELLAAYGMVVVE